MACRPACQLQSMTSKDLGSYRQQGKIGETGAFSPEGTVSLPVGLRARTVGYRVPCGVGLQIEENLSIETKTLVRLAICPDGNVRCGEPIFRRQVRTCICWC